MATFRRYTIEQLETLRDSPLVKKPDALPEIEQWMESAKQQDSNTQRKKAQANTRDDNGNNTMSVGGDNVLGRFSALNLRRTRPEGTTLATRLGLATNLLGGGDIGLGGTNMRFPTNGRTRTDQDKRQTPFDDDSSKDIGGFEDGFFKSAPPSRDKPNGLGNRRPREGGMEPQLSLSTPLTAADGNRWARLEDRFGQGDRSDRNDKDREQRTRNRDDNPLDAPLRRNGVGRGRFEGSWIRPENGNGDSDATRAGFRATSWRDRERDREQQRDNDRVRKDWQRGTKYEPQAEEEPEWMNDDGAEAEAKPSKTQDDFQRWKEEQKQLEANRVAAKAGKETEEGATSKPTPVAAKSAIVLPTLGMFGTFEDVRKSDANGDGASRPPPISKKSSRFEGLFKKDEPPPVPNLLPNLLPNLQNAAEAPARPLPGDSIEPTNEDQAGFQRILQMLGSKGSTPKQNDSAHPPPAAAQQASLEDLFKIGRSPDTRPAENQHESAGLITDMLAHHQERNGTQRPGMQPAMQPAMPRIPPELQAFAAQQGIDIIPSHPERSEPIQPRNEGFPRMPAEGNGDPNNTNRVPMQTQTSPQPLDPKREFLLNLMNRGPQPQQGNPPSEFGMFGMGVSQQQNHLQNQRNTPSAPPGLEPHRRPMPEQEMPGPRRNVPPGFFDNDGTMPENGMIPPGFQRRNTTENNAGPPHPTSGPQTSNLGIPSIRMNEMMMLRNGAPLNVDGRMIGGPPPGLMPPNAAPPGIRPPNGLGPINGPPGPLPNGNMRPNGPPMGPPGFPPQGMPMPMHGMPPGPPPPGGPGQFPMGPHHMGFFPGPGGPPPGMGPPMGGPGQLPGFFGPNGRGFPFEEMRGGGAPAGRGFGL